MRVRGSVSCPESRQAPRGATRHNSLILSLHTILILYIIISLILSLKGLEGLKGVQGGLSLPEAPLRMAWFDLLCTVFFTLTLSILNLYIIISLCLILSQGGHGLSSLASICTKSKKATPVYHDKRR